MYIIISDGRHKVITCVLGYYLGYVSWDLRLCYLREGAVKEYTYKHEHERLRLLCYLF